MSDSGATSGLRTAMVEAVANRPLCGHRQPGTWFCAECDVAAVWPLVEAALLRERSDTAEKIATKIDDWRLATCYNIAGMPTDENARIRALAYSSAADIAWTLARSGGGGGETS